MPAVRRRTHPAVAIMVRHGVDPRVEVLIPHGQCRAHLAVAITARLGVGRRAEVLIPRGQCRVHPAAADIEALLRAADRAEAATEEADRVAALPAADTRLPETTATTN